MNIAGLMLLAGLHLIAGGELSAQAQDNQRQSPFALPDSKPDQAAAGQTSKASPSSSVFRLPDKETKEMQQVSPFALPETAKSSPAAVEPAPMELQPQPEELFREATAAAKQGRYEEAGKMYSHLLQIDPTNVKAMNNLGLVLKKLGRNEEALQAYQIAITTDESYPLTYKNRGILLEEMNDGKGAIEAYRAYIRLAPEAPDAEAVQKRLKWLAQ